MTLLHPVSELVATEFELTAQDVNIAVREFIKQLNDGLQAEGTMMEQLPSYVTAIPTGQEKGTYLAVDVGGTNSRVCSVILHGDGTYSMVQSKITIPRSIKLAKSAKELFLFIAVQIQNFLEKHHNEYLESARRQDPTESGDSTLLKMGFTFSYAVTQLNINSGILLHWDKDTKIDDAIGKDVCALLQDELDALNLPVKITALVNDTVGTLMARAYASSGKPRTILGAVFGTGTNGAYIEKVSKITKLENKGPDYAVTGDMIINAEWGGFDAELQVLPTTSYDVELDKGSVNPGYQLFEKRVSGMYLGEILRLVMLQLVEDKTLFLFQPNESIRTTFLSSIVDFFGGWWNCTKDSQKGENSCSRDLASSFLYKPWSISSELLSVLRADNSKDLHTSRRYLTHDLGLPEISLVGAQALKTIADAIGKRSARLSGVAIGAIILHTGALNQSPAEAEPGEQRQEQEVDIGVDGSLIEFYPGFEDDIRGALREIDGIGVEGEKRIKIGIAKDGGGVGAALTAHMVDMQERSLKV